MTANHDEPTLDDVIVPTEVVRPDHHDQAKAPKHPNEASLDARAEHEQAEVEEDAPRGVVIPRAPAPLASEPRLALSRTHPRVLESGDIMRLGTPSHPSLPVELLTVVSAAAPATQVKTWAEGVMQPLAEKVLPPSPVDRARLGADPDDHSENMPPNQLVDRVAASVGTDLDENAHSAVSESLHWVMGVGAGVAYGLLAHRVPAVRRTHGALFGATLFGATHASLLPALGVQAPLDQLPGAWWIWEAGSHLVYGIATDVALSAVDTALAR